MIVVNHKMLLIDIGMAGTDNDVHATHTYIQQHSQDICHTNKIAQHNEMALEEAFKYLTIF